MKWIAIRGLLSGCLLCCALPGVAAPAADASSLVDNLAALRFDKLGQPQIKSDSIAPVLAPVERPQRLLILPVSFADVGYDRYAGDPDQEVKNRNYFRELLFGGGVTAPRPGTLSDYYRHQSRGRYNITGDILPTAALAHPLPYYGRPERTTDGRWRSDQRDSQLVEDALRAAYRENPDFPWRDYDQWDPYDFDGDGNRDEPDGYLDHLILIVAGKGQSECQGLYSLDQKLNENSAQDALQSLTAGELACADRIWPHQGQLLEQLGSGPQVGGQTNPRGGIDLGNGLWVTNYNAQPEYTDAATFIHEFGHSLGLPDVYAGITENSTGSWEVMSATTGPSPQEMSSWSRIVLGWLQPCLVRPPGYGGALSGTLSMQTMNAPLQTTDGNLCDAAMVILPPKYRDIELGPLTPKQGRQAIYTGQGNDVRRSLSRAFDFSAVPAGTPITLALDAWFEIEAEWDYLYVEVSTDGAHFNRLLPTDKVTAGDRPSVMPAAKGHEGEGSLPGFTGLSGDYDGDGRVEIAPGCNQDQPRVLAEDRLTADLPAQDPCDQAQWVHAEFDLSGLRGQRGVLRFNYFTDGGAVENGALVDNVAIDAIGYHEDFESGTRAGWDNQGFTLSSGHHHLAVPHFFLLEYRDPYAQFPGETNYDAALAKPGFLFYPGSDGMMRAVNFNYRPGLLVWYYDGEYLWSENEPSELGPGNGFLLAVDANPQEFELDALPARYFSRDERGWTAWDLDDSAQPLLRRGFLQTLCYQRRPPYYPVELPAADRASCAGSLTDGLPPMESVMWDGRRLEYGYTIINDLLPGADRDARKSGNSLFDLRLRGDRLDYRLNDAALRNAHSADAPFSTEPFEAGIERYQPRDGVLTRIGRTPFPAVSTFEDSAPDRYQNPRLPFGGVTLPASGFGFELLPPAGDSPPGTRVRVRYHWRTPTSGTP